MPACRDAMAAAIFFLGRYKIFKGAFEHQSATSVVVQRPPARAPFFDFVAGLMRFALRPSAALARQRSIAAAAR